MSDAEKTVNPEQTENCEPEKKRTSLVEGLEKFDRSQLKHTVTEIKNPLPSLESKYNSQQID